MKKGMKKSKGTYIIILFLFSMFLIFILNSNFVSAYTTRIFPRCRPDPGCDPDDNVYCGLKWIDGQEVDVYKFSNYEIVGGDPEIVTHPNNYFMRSSANNFDFRYDSKTGSMAKLTFKSGQKVTNKDFAYFRIGDKYRKPHDPNLYFYSGVFSAIEEHEDFILHQLRTPSSVNCPWWTNCFERAGYVLRGNSIPDYVRFWIDSNDECKYKEECSGNKQGRWNFFGPQGPFYDFDGLKCSEYAVSLETYDGDDWKDKNTNTFWIKDSCHDGSGQYLGFEYDKSCELEAKNDANRLYVLFKENLDGTLDSIAVDIIDGSNHEITVKRFEIWCMDPAFHGLCTDTDGGKKYYIYGQCTDEGWGITYGDQCQSSTNLKEYYCDSQGGCTNEIHDCSPGTCQQGRCCDTIETKCNDGIDNDCNGKCDINGCGGMEKDPNCYCDITSASITPNCEGNPGQTTGCDIFDAITLNAEFDGGGCTAVDFLKINVKSISNSFNMTILCDLSQSSTCSGDFDLPICYDDEIFSVKNASGHDSSDELIVYNDQDITGQFQFTDECSQLISIDLKPDFAGMIFGQSISLLVNATLEKGGETFYEDVTLSIHTDYRSNDTNVIKIIPSSTEFKVLALGEGFAHVNASYPWNFINEKKDTSYFIVGPNVGCSIDDASIELDCGGDNKCDKDEKITMSIDSSGNCAQFLDQGGYIIMRADDNGECSVEMKGSFDEPCIACSADWLITETNVDWEKCSGKTVTIKHVEVWDKTNPWPIGVLHQEIDSFQFYTPNIPPIAKITKISGTVITGPESPPVCQQQQPTNGHVADKCFDITEPITFEQESEDPDDSPGCEPKPNGIRIWQWFIKPFDDAWKLFHMPFYENIPSFDFNFENNGYISGTYDFKHKVIDCEGASDEVENYEIILWDGESAIADITKPGEEEEIENPVDILFNGSENSWAQGLEEDWWFEWTYDNEIMKEGNKEEASSFEYTFTEPKSEYNVLLTVYNTGLPELKGYDSVLFYIANCLGTGGERVFAGECIPGKEAVCAYPPMGFENANCNDKFCCNSGKVCDDGTCVFLDEDCDTWSGTSADTCQNTHPSCYWKNTQQKECLTCFEDSKPASCSDYNNLDACGIDNCGMGHNGLGTEICGQTIIEGGIQYYVSNCHCEWDSNYGELGTCALAYTSTEQGVGGGSEDCQYSIDYKDCGEDPCTSNERPVIYDLIEEISGENCREDYEECQPCAILFRPLPFFSWWHVLAVLSLLIVFYVIFRKKLSWIKKR